VLNLSYASGSALPYNTDPLTFALERAWKAGIVVVVAAGNDGRQSHTLASPALDPYVIAVGAVEAKANGSYKVPSWASSGDGTRNPDLAAPGAHIDSLRAPGSRIDIEHPEGYVSDTLFRGSGSSQAAAVASGAAALLIDAQPGLSPDQVKALLMGNTVKATPHKPVYSGNGVIQVDKAVKAARRGFPDAQQTWPASDGTGLLEAARGPVHMVIDGQPVVGEVTVLGVRWTGADTEWQGVRWTGDNWMGVRWTSGAWTGVRWTGVRWTDLEWTGVRWTDGSWTGVRWTGVRWTGVRWTGTAWEGVRWTTGSWSGTSWDGVRWTDDSWSAAVWDGVRWTGVRWTGTRWDGVRWTGSVWDGVRWTGVRWTGVRWTGVRWTDDIWSSTAWSGGAWE
jgi:serine protease AprX